jgi:hypothetical protein
MILATCILSATLSAQSPLPVAAPAAPPDPERARQVEGQAALPYSIVEIRRALNEGPSVDAVRLAETPIFRVNVESRRAQIDTFLDDLNRLPWQPIPGTSPTHSELLAMTTPVMAQPYGAFGSASEVAQVIATSYAFALATQGVVKLVSGLHNSLERAKVNKLRRAVDDELAELERNNKAAANDAPPAPAIKK